MANKQLIDYIRQKIQNGIDQDTIKKDLLINNWVEPDIDDAFAQLGLSANKEQTGNILSQALKSQETVRSDLIGNVIQKGALISHGISLAQLIPAVIIFIGAFVYAITSIGLPWYIGGFFIFLLIVILSIEVLYVKRISSVNLNEVPNQTAKSVDIAIDLDEALNFTIPGVMRSGFRLRGIEYFGKEKVRDPENALIITNKHIHCIVVPIAGTGQLISGTDIGMVDWIIARKDIANKLDQMLSTMPLLDVLKCDPRNYSLSLADIKEIKSSNLQHAITFVTQNGKKYSFSIRDNEDYQKLKEINKT